MVQVVLSANHDVFADINERDGTLSVRASSDETRAGAAINKLLSLKTYAGGASKELVPLSRTQTGWDVGANDSVILCINDQPFVQLQKENGLWKESVKLRRYLNATETRMLGSYELGDDAPPFPSKIMPLKNEEPVLLTDLHTHLSGQISAEAILNIAGEKGIGFPADSLEKIGINCSKKPTFLVKFRLFLPEAHLYEGNNIPKETPGVLLEDLTTEEKQKLMKAMCLSAERQSTYGTMERCYNLREPITKEIDAFQNVLTEVAEGYQKQGVTYSELSTNAVVDPGWLEQTHRIVDVKGTTFLDKLEERTGTSIRFLVGIPRNFPEGDVSARLEEIKKLKDSPYVAGIDWLGFENNKTDDLAPHITEFAEWMKDNRPDWVMRIHAGENGKNRGNVRQALKLAERLHIRMRIGHGLYGMDDETLNLAQKLAKDFRESGGKKGADFMFEVCPDSNLANNHFEYPTESTLKELIDRDVPTVLSSDGASLYQVDSKQMVHTAKLAGLTDEHFAKIRATEEAYIARQQAIYQDRFKNNPTLEIPPLRKLPPPQKTTPVPRAGYTDHLPDFEKPADERRKPLAIIGSNGTPWDDLSAPDQKEIVAQLRALILGGRIDPAKTYLVMGRIKQNDDGTVVKGVEGEVLKIVNEYNKIREDIGAQLPPLECHMVVAEDKEPERAPPEGITKKLHLRNALVYVADDIVPMLREMNGMIVAIGGLTYTRDMILLGHESGLAMALANNETTSHLTHPGASYEKARVYPNLAFKTAAELGEKVAQWCPEGIDINGVRKHYADYLSKTVHNQVIGK